MKRIVLVALFVIVAIALALLYITYSRPAPAAVALLADSTLLFVDIPDFPTARRTFHRTQAAALWQEPEVQAFTANLQASVAEYLGFKDATAAGRFIDKILGTIQGEAFVAITHLGALQHLQAGVIVGADLKRGQIETSAALAYYEHELRTERPGIAIESKRYLGVSYTVWRLSPSQQLCHAFLRSMIVVTVNEDDLRDVITRYTGHAPAEAQSLGFTPGYQSALKTLPAAPALRTFLNTGPLFSLLRPLTTLTKQSAGMLDGLTRMQSIATSYRFTDAGLCEEVSITAYNKPAPQPTLPVSGRMLAFTSPQTTLYTTHSIDFASTYLQLMDGLAQSGKPELVNNAGDFEKLLTRRSINIRRDLLPALGPEIAVVATWRTGSRTPDFAFITTVTNAATTRTQIDTTMDAMKQSWLGNDEKFPWDVADFLGEQTHTVRIGSGQVSPTYATTADFLIIASTPDYARELITQHHQNKPSLATNPAYAQAAQRLPRNSTAQTYCDLRSVFPPFYAMAKAGTVVTGTNQVVQMDKLPKVETFTRHLTPFISATVTGPLRETTTTISPLSKPLTLVVAGLTGLLAAQPYLGEIQARLNPAAAKTSSDTAFPVPPLGIQPERSQIPELP